MESRLDIDVPSQSLHRLGTSKHCDLDLTSFESWGANNIEDDGVINETQNPKKGIAKWYFNKKKRKRQYISLTGKKLEGYEATVQYRLDKMSSKHPSRSSRIELKHLIETINIHHLLDAFNNDDHTKYDYLTQLSAWGLPPRTIAKYAYRKILRLFPWQVDCLCIDNGSVLYGNNLVYSAPTSGGKTLVTEILMLRRIVKKMGTILFIVPFVALVIEKSEYFRDIWSDLHISVQAYHGDETSNDLHPDLDVCVCTFERANIM
jgi:superfamily II RNA helicase